MRLTSVYISQYKNLKDFTLNFDGNSFIDVFVGKNGTGKSNLFEALLEIFRHLYEYDKDKSRLDFNYSISFSINSEKTEITWSSEFEQFTINGKTQKTKTIGKTPLPDNILIYYSGHNDTVTRLITKYENTFRDRIKEANFGESRKFIGIGSEYKELLLSVLLIQQTDNKAKQYICEKLDIQDIAPEIKLKLKRPHYAKDKTKTKFNIEYNNESDRYWKPEGITKEFLDRLSKCQSTSDLIRSEGYFRNDDYYILYFDIIKIQKEFGYNSQKLFSQFDNLKTINMLEEISIPLTLKNGSEASISHFSDGQFQSVYIYSIVEIFKDSNCITLLDEPDSFLHPEWQFEFLKQVFEIADSTAQNNHVLMSSHSAVTLIPHNNKKIKFFDIRDNRANCYDLIKSVAIKKLSSDLIKYSEQEQILSIINAIQIEHKPVLFTEGSTDPIIIKEAWYKLFDEEMPFIPFYGFSCTYINQLLTDNRIHAEMGELPIFALFDFDKAYDQWNGLNGQVSQNNPSLGMIKKWASGNSYAIMIPVPNHPDISKQVIKNASTNETFGGGSCCEIEHLFYGQEATANYYESEACAGGSQIVFKSDNKKIKFAKEVVPTLNAVCFEVFRPMFEFIRSKC